MKNKRATAILSFLAIASAHIDEIGPTSTAAGPKTRFLRVGSLYPGDDASITSKDQTRSSTIYTKGTPISVLTNNYTSSWEHVPSVLSAVNATVGPLFEGLAKQSSPKLDRHEPNTSALMGDSVVWAVYLDVVNGMDVFIGACIDRDGAIFASTLDLHDDSSGGSGSVYAFSKGGERLWWRTFSPSPTVPTVSSDGRLYLGSMSNGTKGAFRCFNSSTGMDIWTFTPKLSLPSAPGAQISFAAPIISPDGQTGYFFSECLNIYAMSMDGEFQWSREIGAYTVAAPAISAEGNLVFASIDGSLWSLSALGDNLWLTESNEVHDSFSQPPCIGDNDQIYVSGYYSLYSFDKTGSYQWKYETVLHPLPMDSVVSPIYFKGVLYFGILTLLDDFHLYAFNSVDGSVLWHQTIASPVADEDNDRRVNAIVNYAIDRSGMIHVYSTDSYLYALNTSDRGSFVAKKKVNVSRGYGMTPAFGDDGSTLVGGYNFILKLKKIPQ